MEAGFTAGIQGLGMSHWNPLRRFCRQPGWRRSILALCVWVGMLGSPASFAWGPKVHRLVNGWAIQTLPEEMRGFFEANRQELIDHATDPEVWMLKDRYERMRHYIFLDRYGRFPYTKLPHSYKVALQQIGSSRMTRNGTLPWQIGEFSLRLTNDFKQQKWDQARIDAAALGFYVADAHDPLQTTENFDGQLTSETGLATRFGTVLADRYSHFFMFRSEDAEKVADPTEYAFQIVLESNTWVDQILLADLLSRADLLDYNGDYYDRFYTRAGSIVMTEVSGAAHDTGSYWFTAWLNAGKPALPPR